MTPKRTMEQRAIDAERACRIALKSLYRCHAIMSLDQVVKESSTGDGSIGEAIQEIQATLDLTEQEQENEQKIQMG